MTRFRLMLCVFISGALTGCVSAPRETAASYKVEFTATGKDVASDAGASSPPQASASFPAEQTRPVKLFLSAIHARIKPRWDQVRSRSSAWLPPDHPANQPGRKVEIEVWIDHRGRPHRLRIVQSSGNGPFDASAVQIVEQINELPPVPDGLPAGHPVLRWWFHRDDRSCDPSHARLGTSPFSIEDELRWTLNRKQWGKARKILEQHPERTSLVALVARMGVDSNSPELRTLGLRATPSAELITLMLSRQPREQWSVALQTLVDRRDRARIIALMERKSRRPPEAENTRRMIELIDAASRADVRPPRSLAMHLLASKDPVVVSAALPLVHDPKLLAPLGATWRKNPAVSSAVLVRRLSLGNDEKALVTVRRSLSGRSRGHALAALVRFPIPALRPDVAGLVKRPGVSAPHRIAGIKIVTGDPAFIGTIYASLRASVPAVQIAAVHSLLEFHPNKRAASFRLADVAYRLKGKGPVTAEALRAQIHIGLDAFRMDVIYRLSRLAPKHQAMVASVLWRYGSLVVGKLTQMLDSKHAPLREAAAASLAKIPNAKARRALARAKLKTANRKRGKAAPPSRDDPLARLLREAVRIANRSAAKTEG